MRDFFRQALDSLRAEQTGATFLEYTVLLGIILSVLLLTLSMVGSWAQDQ